MAFVKATKYGAKLRLALAGPAGSGKTYSALAIARALAGDDGSIALVDTEHGSASKYAGVFDFDTMQLGPPYHPNRFVGAIREAEAGGYDVVVLDSISHAWFGPGGVLEIVDRAAVKYHGNQYAGWKDGTPAHQLLIEGILSSKVHVIATMRSKQEYILTTDQRGKQVPQKVGMAPVQRDGMEYEFDVFAELDLEHNAVISKTRCPELTGKVYPKPGGELAGILREWLAGDPPPSDGLADGPFYASAVQRLDSFTTEADVRRAVLALGKAYPANPADAGQLLKLLAPYGAALANGASEAEAAEAALSL